MGVQKPRQIAVNVLRRYEDRFRFLSSTLESELTAARLAAVDRSLVQELTYGAVRWQRTLDWLILRKANQAVQKPLVQIILRLGLYQILWLNRIPDHAAVHETVALTHDFGCGGQAGFVNAVLRDYLRERDATRQLLQELKETDPALGHSHPEWLYQRWEQRWGREVVRQFLEWNNTPARVYARLNRLKTTPEQLAAQWQEEGVKFEPRAYPWVEPGLVYEVESQLPLPSLPSFEQGLFYIQDPSTLLAVEMMNPQPGDSTLDFCAAPGGKTTCLAQRMQNRGYLMAQDTDIHRRNAIKQNCLRLGVSIVSISRATTAINFDLSEPFDKVLVDAPCSNTGVMRRRVDLRWRISQEELGRLSQLQGGLLHRASRQVKPGGILVYSTCSLEDEENGQSVREFLSTHPAFVLEEERSLLPWVDQVDGAYGARVRLTSG